MCGGLLERSRKATVDAQGRTKHEAGREWRPGKQLTVLSSRAGRKDKDWEVVDEYAGHAPCLGSQESKSFLRCC